MPRIADRMTPDLHACVERGNAAERAGELQDALEWHRAVPMFEGGRHRVLLERLSSLGGDLPPWAWARWIAYLTTRCEDGDLGEMVKYLVVALTRSVHGDLLDECRREGGDPMRVMARIAGESWIHHQIAVHEAGGLLEFIDRFVTGPLADHAELARSWAGARMSGYVLGASLTGARLQVRDVRQDTWTEILDLGARSCSRPGGHVIGRLVPSGVGEVPMFDIAPLHVGADLAEQVANSDDWRVLLSDLLSTGRDSGAFLREDYEITTDVQELDLIRFATPAGELDETMRRLRSGRDEGSRAAYRVLGRARDGDLDEADQAWVGAAAQFPRALEDARRRLVRTGGHCVWESWAERVAGPGRGRLLALAEAARAAA